MTLSRTLYQFLLLGASSDRQIAALTQTVTEQLLHFGLHAGVDFQFLRSCDPPFEDTVPTVALFFGQAGLPLPEHGQLQRLSIPVIPIVSSLAKATVELPAELQPINALALSPADKDLVAPAGLALQALGLLPSQRRVFVSYRRDESRDAAVQLFEQLSARTFDVFLDTHSVGAGADFQEMLWHRFCDSDVIVLLDTPNYFKSRWTAAEWGRAVDKNIPILHVVWPGHTAARIARLATLRPLDASDFAGAQLTTACLDSIALQLEAMRSMSTALRHATLSGIVRTAVEDLGGSVLGVGPHRSMVLSIPPADPIVAYPIVGVPTARHVQDANVNGDTRQAALIYDHVGISENWLRHIQWLRTNFRVVKWVRSRQALWELADSRGL